MRTLSLALVLLATAGARADDLPPTTVHTKPPFDPTVDGLPFENSGDFESPDGNCFGMSLTSISNFLKRKESGDAKGPAKEKAVKTEAASVPDEERVSYLQENVSQNPMHEAKLDDPSNVLAALKRIDATGIPEIFTMTGSQGGHANVIFGYEDGCVLLLDPNYPHQTIRWPFDFEKGFGTHPLAKSLGKGKDFYAVLKTAGSTPFAKFKAAKEIEVLNDPAKLEKASIPRYPDTTVTASRAKADGPVVLSGTVAGGPKKDEDGNKAQQPNRVWLTVDDKPVAHANVASDGSFKLDVPSDVVKAGSTVHVVATVDSTSQDARNKNEDWHMFSGYADVDPKEILDAKPSKTTGFVNKVGR